jgi:hypothetical protein
LYEGHERLARVADPGIGSYLIQPGEQKVAMSAPVPLASGLAAELPRKLDRDRGVSREYFPTV